MQNQNIVNVVVGTSIAPFNIEIQKNAIHSWILCGLKVISCNVKKEIAELKDQFPDVEFVEIDRTADETGKALPYFQDILSLAAKRCDAVCGFINSDIILDSSVGEMLAYICHEAERSLIYLHRNEIDSVNDISQMNWDMHFDGIDLFFVDKEIAPFFFDEGFYVQSLWCQALLIKCRKLGITMKELVNPIAFHVKHTIRWNIENYDLLLKDFVNRNFNKSKNYYAFLLDNYYSILLNGTIKICYCDYKDEKCSITGSIGDLKLESLISKQNYPNIKIIDNEVADEKDDLIFVINDDVVLSECFISLIVWMFRHFNCKKIELGAFFISEINSSFTYNEINRNMYFMKSLYSRSDRYSVCVFSQTGQKEFRTCHPEIRKYIDLKSAPFISKQKIMQNTYMMPAGNRACEWLERFKLKISGDYIRGFLDNAESKAGKTVRELKVYPPSLLDKVNENILVIVASKYYHQEIIQSLEHRNYVQGILNASCILDIDETGTIYYFDENLYLKYLGEKMRERAVVSIIVPVYNAEGYLERCIESILGQTYIHTQLILVNDGSADNSASICERFQKKDRCIVYIQQKNQGVVCARKTGIKYAEGEYVTFVDADDYLECDYIEQMVAQMKDAQLVSSGFFKWEGKRFDRLEKKDYRTEEELFYLMSNLIRFEKGSEYGMLCSLCNKLFCTEIMKKVMENASEEIFFGEDAELFYKYILRCSYVKITGICGYHYCSNENSCTHTAQSDYLINLHKLYYSLLKEFQLSKYSEVLIPQLEKWISALIVAAPRVLGFDEENQLYEDIYPYSDNLCERKIVVYGAGVVGGEYVRQIISKRLAKLVFWCDKEKCGQYKQGIEIKTPDVLLYEGYDFIILAIRFEGVALAIKRELIEQGISEEKILWKEPWSPVC